MRQVLVALFGLGETWSSSSWGISWRQSIGFKQVEPYLDGASRRSCALCLSLSPLASSTSVVMLALMAIGAADTPDSGSAPKPLSSCRK